MNEEDIEIKERLDEILDFLKESFWASEKEKMGNIFLNFSIIMFFSLIVSYNDILSNLKNVFLIGENCIKIVLNMLIVTNFLYIFFKIFTSNLPNLNGWAEVRIRIDKLFSISYVSLFLAVPIALITNSFYTLQKLYISILVIVLLIVIFLIMLVLFNKYIEPRYLPFFSSLTKKEIITSVNEENELDIRITNNFRRDIPIKFSSQYDVDLISVIYEGPIKKRREGIYDIFLLKNQERDIKLIINGKNLGICTLKISIQFEAYKKLFEIPVKVQ